MRRETVDDPGVVAKDFLHREPRRRRLRRDLFGSEGMGLPFGVQVAEARARNDVDEAAVVEPGPRLGGRRVGR